MTLTHSSGFVISGIARWFDEAVVHDAHVGCAWASWILHAQYKSAGHIAFCQRFSVPLDLDHAIGKDARAEGISLRELDGMSSPYCTQPFCGSYIHTPMRPPATSYRTWTIRQITERAVPGSIIVLYDGKGHGSKVARILEIVLPQLKAEGFEFVTIERMQTLDSAGSPAN